MAGNTAKVMARTPDEVVFNGVAAKYQDHPLQAQAGQRVRLYVVNAGPNLSSAFHVIGAIFAAFIPNNAVQPQSTRRAQRKSPYSKR